MSLTLSSRIADGVCFAPLTPADTSRLATLRLLTALTDPRRHASCPSQNAGVRVGAFVDGRLDAASEMRPVADSGDVAEITFLNVPALPILLAERLIARAVEEARRRGWLRLRWRAGDQRDPWRRAFANLGLTIAEGGDLWLRFKQDGDAQDVN